MESLEMCLAGGLHELGLLEQFKLNTLIHHWRDVVGPIYAGHTRIIDIKPPKIVLSADNSQWMQEVKMNQKRILKAINDYYKSDIITEMGLIMHRQSYVKETVNTEILKIDMPDIDGYIDMSKIVLSNDDMKSIDAMVESLAEDTLKEPFRKVLISSRKKEVYLLEHGYHRCERCHTLMSRQTKYCVSCEYEIHRNHINDIKTQIRRRPYIKYSEAQQYIKCTFKDFSIAMRELIYFYLDKVYHGSTSRNHMYMTTMLITHKRLEELTDQHVINLCNKYRFFSLQQDNSMKKDGFSEIYDIYFPKLLRFTKTYLISEDESENIVQEIFIYLWEHRDIIETLQNLNAYLFTLAKNRCIDYFRKEMVREVRKGSLSEIENRELQLKLYSLEAFDNDRLSDADIEEILNNAINRLPERCREIFIMSRLQNLRYKEIAEKLNVSPNTVENQIVIALRKLKEDLKDYFPLFVFII